MKCVEMRYATVAVVMMSVVAVIALLDPTVGNGGDPKVSYPSRWLSFRYISVENVRLAPGWLDIENKVFYQYHGICVRAMDAPETVPPYGRIPALDAAKAKLSVVEVEASVVCLVGKGDKFDVGYFIPSCARVYRWKGVELTKEQAQKAFPVAIKNAIDARKLELSVTDIDVSDEVRSRWLNR